jgi:hypothetical protein
MTMDEGRSGYEWRPLSRPALGLADAISNSICVSNHVQDECLRALRSAPSLLMFSDYGGAHKQARYEVLSFLVSTVHGLESFDAERRRLRECSLGSERRMSYKALNDRMRMRSLRTYLAAADQLQGLLVSFALDKRAINRLSEDYKSDTAFGRLGPWAQRPFNKLTRVGHLASILIEGIRRDGQNLVWITDEDEIAPNDLKHSEATKILSHYLNYYCSGPMGHFRFGTTTSDTGDLLIEDLAAVPDLAAGGLGEVLSLLAPHPESSSVGRLYLPGGGDVPAKVTDIATWLGNPSGNLQKLSLVIDEGEGGCSIRDFGVVTRLEEL